MATTTICDYVIWTKHIHGDAELAKRVAAMTPGETIDLNVDGATGTWRRMEDGKDGRATLGLRPIGRTRQVWKAWFKERRDEVVTLELAQFDLVGVEDGGDARGAVQVGRFLRSDAERQAALAALVEGALQGWRSEGRTVSRDDLHER